MLALSCTVPACAPGLRAPCLIASLHSSLLLYRLLGLRAPCLHAFFALFTLPVGALLHSWLSFCRLLLRFPSCDSSALRLRFFESHGVASLLCTPVSSRVDVRNALEIGRAEWSLATAVCNVRDCVYFSVLLCNSSILTVDNINHSTGLLCHSEILTVDNHTTACCWLPVQGDWGDIGPCSGSPSHLAILCFTWPSHPPIEILNLTLLFIVAVHQEGGARAANRLLTHHPRHRHAAEHSAPRALSACNPCALIRRTHLHGDVC